jgi:hypothetical protein
VGYPGDILPWMRLPWLSAHHAPVAVLALLRCNNGCLSIMIVVVNDVVPFLLTPLLLHRQAFEAGYLRIDDTLWGVSFSQVN